MKHSIRIAVIGADGGTASGHAVSFCRMLQEGFYPAKVVAIYAEQMHQAAEIAADTGIELVAETAEQAIVAADAVLVMQRNGNLHKQYAVFALEHGKHVFVDKPLACTIADAREIVAAARRNRCILCSGSTVLYAEQPRRIADFLKGEELQSGYLAFPLVNQAEYGGIHFYSHHLLAEASVIFGEDIQAVTAVCVGGNVAAVAEYKTFPLLMNFAVDYSGLHMAVYTKSGKSIMKELSLYQTDTIQLEAFLKAVLTNTQPQLEQALLWPVIISCAIEASMQTGKKVWIKDICGGKWF